jgi:hypothetical protein
MTWFYWQLKILILTLAKSSFVIVSYIIYIINYQLTNCFLFIRSLGWLYQSASFETLATARKNVLIKNNNVQLLIFFTLLRNKKSLTGLAWLKKSVYDVCVCNKKLSPQEKVSLSLACVCAHISSISTKNALITLQNSSSS